ncbi:hypothetical protein [Paenibacillus luteus]|uniref:hypothetical protein n=1 Tax=Paenibacillus luteus TaxID=2545753 RepID=UPI001141CEC5|nr:hypothetical protein [Paenibacillus luteus]
MKASIREYYKNDKKIIVWGSGSGYLKWSQQIDFHASYIIDNNKERWNEEVNGVKIKSPDVLNYEEKEKTVIFVLSYFFEEISKQLLKLGFKDKNIVSLKMLERKINHETRLLRRVEFLSETSLSMQEFIEGIIEGISGIKYREVELVPVLLPYIALLTSYLYEEDVYKNLFPIPLKREYHMKGAASILISYVWHKDHRPDHYELMKETLKELPASSYMEMELKSYYDDRKYTSQETFEYTASKLEFKALVKKLSLVLNEKKFCLSSIEIEWLIHFTVYFLHFIDFSHVLLSKYPIKKYVTAFSNNSEENIIVQVAKGKGVKTLGLQHGTFGRKHEYNSVPFSHVYKYPTVDKMLVWGVHQAEILNEIKLDNSEILVIGQAKYNLTDVEREGLLTHRKKFVKNKTFLIAFMGPGNREKEINQDILTFSDRLCEEFGWKYLLKVHPGNNISLSELQYNHNNCEEIITTHTNIRGLLKNIDFIITSSSVIIYEAIYEYIPALVYDYHPAVNSICGGLSTIFNDYNELNHICTRLLLQEEYEKLKVEYKHFGNKIFQTDYKRPTEKYKNIIQNN